MAFCLKTFIRSVNLQNKQQSVRAQKTEDYAIGSIVSGYMRFVCKEALLFLCRNTYFFLAAFSSFAGATGL